MEQPIRPPSQLRSDPILAAAPTASRQAVDDRVYAPGFGPSADDVPGDAQALFAMAFEDAPIGIAVVLPDGRYIHANPALCELFGRSREELRSLTWRDLTHPDDLAADHAAIRAATAAASRRITIDKRFVHRDGTPRFVRLNASILRDEHGAERYSIVQVEDVSGARRSEQALSAAEERFRATFDHAPLGMAMIDLAGRLADVNEALCAMTGHTRAALLGTPVDELGFAGALSSLHAAEAAAKGAATAASDLAALVETPLARSDGSVIWVAISSYLVLDGEGRPLHRFAQFRDISEQRQTEEVLRESERRFARMFENAPIGMSLLAMDRTRLAANAALAELTGYTVDELLVAPYGSLTYPDDHARVGPLSESLFAGEIDDYSLEVRIVGKGGRVLAVEVVASLIRDEQGTPLYVMGQLADADTRRRLERQLQEAAKLEAMGRLAGGVAHDFNNMLLVVRGYSHLLLQRLPADDPARADALEIDRAAERAAQLVGQLLAFGRRQLLQPRALDLNEIVTRLEGLVRGLTGSAIELRITLAPAVELVRADPAQLEQIIVSLVINSRDATPNGGVITIATSAVRLGTLTAAKLRVAPGRYALLEVADSGIGMDALTSAQAFEPFFTTKRDATNAGLGLASVHGAITQTGGGIALESAPGAGTTVRVYLPLASSAAPPADSSHGGGALPAPMVLVVEQDARLRALYTRTIRGGGFTAVAFASPIEVLAWLDIAAASVDVVLSDTGVADSHGAELAREVHARRPEAAVLLVSDSPPRPREGAPGRHRVRGLEKPFTTDALLAAVEACLADRAVKP